MPMKCVYKITASGYVGYFNIPAYVGVIYIHLSVGFCIARSDYSGQCESLKTRDEQKVPALFFVSVSLAFHVCLFLPKCSLLPRQIITPTY